MLPQSASDLIIPQAVLSGLVWLTQRDWRWFIIGVLLFANVFTCYWFFHDWLLFINAWHPTYEAQFPGSTSIALIYSVMVFPAVCAMGMGISGLALAIWAAIARNLVNSWWVRFASMFYCSALGLFWVTVAGMVVVGKHSFLRYPSEFHYGAIIGSVSAIWGLGLIDRFCKQKPSSRKLLLNSFLVLTLFSPTIILYSFGLGTIWWGTMDDPLRLFPW